MQGLDLLDSEAFDLSDWDQRLPPPAAKTAVQTLTVVVISPEQAGDFCSSRVQFEMSLLVYNLCRQEAAKAQIILLISPGLITFEGFHLVCALADKGLKCPVCLLEFEEQETVREMPCKHLFHSGCILPWLGKVNM